MDCETCGEPFTPRRPNARYCSTRCRQRGYRDRRAPVVTTSEARREGDDPAEVLRRLYFTKLDALERIGWAVPVMREREALDYACSYLPSCRIGPMPEGGLTELEDDLCAELGLDRHAGGR